MSRGILDDDEFRIRLRSHAPQQSMPRLGRLGSLLKGKTLGHLLMRRGAGVHVPTPAKGTPGAITKVKYMPTGRTAGYAAYMQRDKAEAAKTVSAYMESHGGPEGKAALFTREGQTVDLDAFIQTSRRDPRVWTIILAPEHGNRLDMQAYTQRFMEQVEDDTSHRLDWVGACHYNTDHHHAHLLIRGRDQDGEIFRLAKDYVRTGLRSRAMELQASWLEHGLTHEPQQTRTQDRSLVQGLEQWATQHARDAGIGW